MKCLAPLLMLAALILSLSGCVTETVGGEKPKVNLGEAARANAQLGIEYARKGQFDLALEKLLRSLDQDSDYAPAHATIAILYARRGEDAKAESHYRRAISLDPKDANTRNNFAVFECNIGRVKEGEEQFLAVARDRSYSTPEVAWTNAGVCVKRINATRAENYFREALKANPNFPDALMEMATLAAQSKDFLRVRAFLQRRDRAAAPTAQSLRLAAKAERQLGDAVAAERYEQQLRHDFPEAANAGG